MECPNLLWGPGANNLGGNVADGGAYNRVFRYQSGRGARAATSLANYLARRLLQVPNFPEFKVRRTPSNWAPVQAYAML